MIVAEVMEELAVRLDTIDGLRAFGWPVGSLVPPAAVVGYPDQYRFDASYGRGYDTMTIPIVVVVGKATDRTARDLISAYVSGSGASSVKAVIESGPYTSLVTATVTGVTFDTYTKAAVDYLAAVFDVDITGPGR